MNILLDIIPKNDIISSVELVYLYICNIISIRKRGEKLLELALNKKTANPKYKDLLFIMLIFGVFLRFAIGVGYYNPQDTLWYKEWALGLNDGLFSIYSKAHIIDLDYPPIYLFFLRLTGMAYEAFGESVHPYLDMFIMKFWPIVGDVLCGLVIYLVLKRKSQKTALVASAFWIFNPSAIFNSSFWGQTDSIMCMLLLLSFVFLNEKPILASVVFALAGMTKFQCLFFTPVFLGELFVKFRLSKFLKGVGAAAVTVALVFLPFMIGSENPLLFFDVYLYGQGRYPYCTLNAYNIYGLFGLNWIQDSFGFISLNTFSMLLIVLSIAGIIATYIFAKRTSVWVMGFLFMNTLFMFMTRMHERYQFVVLIFILMAAIVHKSRSFFYIFMGMSFITFINQLIPMFSWRSDNSFFGNYYGELMVIFSAVNIILYILSAYFCLKFLFSSKSIESN